eukprot:PhF_6_TR37558/c0_g1_i1/m.55649
MKTPGVVRIGCFAGFWGDCAPYAAAQIARSREGESIDYLVADYLAEVTMCILAKGKNKPTKNMGEGGFVEEFATTVWAPLGQLFMEKRIKVVTNAGGLNPRGLKRLIEKLSEKFPVRPVVACVEGDDILTSLPDLHQKGVLEGFSVDGAPTDTDAVPGANSKHLTANAYLGAGAIARAIELGADVVVTGRVVDSALVLAPLMAEYQWKTTDYDLLAAGSIAGHIIECGAQCTGGNFTDWELAAVGGANSPSTSTYFANIGFPIVAVKKDGSFVVTKPQGTGGIVSRLSVAEQAVYEIGDPSQYRLPDVDCDMTQMTITEVGRNQVEIAKIRGNPPSGKYKVSVTTPAGLTMGNFMFGVAGYDATAKAKVIAASVIARSEGIIAKMGLGPYQSVLVEVIGSEMLYGPNASTSAQESREVVLRLSASHKNPRALAILGSQLPSASTGMAAGIFGPLGPPRPAPSPNIRLTSLMVNRTAIPVTVWVGPEEKVVREDFVAPSVAPRERYVVKALPPPRDNATSGGTVRAPLVTIACCRSGDKGDAANVAVIARNPEYFDFLRQNVTIAAVERFFKHWQAPKGATVQRYELPGLSAMNFVLSKVLGGGGLMSLKSDKQAKTLGTLLLSMQLDIPTAWVNRYETNEGKLKKEIVKQIMSKL